MASTTNIWIAVVIHVWGTVMFTNKIISIIQPVVNTCFDDILQKPWKDQNDSDLFIFENQTIVFDVMIFIKSSSIGKQNFSRTRCSWSHDKITVSLVFLSTYCYLLSVWCAHSCIVIEIVNTTKIYDRTLSAFSIYLGAHVIFGKAIPR